MAAQKKDYYEILGVSKNATDEEIRSAYKKLIKQWHPDRNPDNRKEAEQKFKEIQEAYEVLSDPEKKAMYDRFGYVGEGYAHTYGQQGVNFEDIFNGFEDIFNIFFGGGTTRQSSQTTSGRRVRRGEDININLVVDDHQVFTGTTVQVDYERMEKCEHCNGEGVEPGSRWVTCPKCRGTGVVREEKRTPFGVYINQYSCDNCGGTGTIPGQTCSSCKGNGRVRKTVKYSVNVPAGVDNGTVLRISGMGNAGLHGGGYGDLIVHIRVRKTMDYERQNDDIIITKKIDYVQAILGGTLSVELPSKEIVEVEIPSGTQPDDLVTVKGKGFPSIKNAKRGNLIVRLKVEIPKRVSSKERELLKQIAKEKGL